MFAMGLQPDIIENKNTYPIVAAIPGVSIVAAKQAHNK
jgi:hypothetical protein